MALPHLGANVPRLGVPQLGWALSRRYLTPRACGQKLRARSGAWKSVFVILGLGSNLRVELCAQRPWQRLASAHPNCGCLAAPKCAQPELWRANTGRYLGHA